MKSIFESWEIKDLIGKGNFGAVYEIEKDGEKEAMKVVNIYPSNTDFNEILGVDNHGELEEKTSLVMKEIDMLYHLKGNTHIVNYIDHYVDKKEDVYSLYLKMEYLQRLDNYYGKEIESDKALSITYDILDALTICEDNNIVHGDIKPQNIMVDNHGNNKLTDFGISKIMNQEKISNYTPAYAAPEIITDGRYTKQSDLYSLGLVIYQIYNNNLLPFMKNNFEKKDTSKIIERRLNKDVPAPTNGSKELNEFLSKALNRNPEERFQSAKEMKDELQRLDNNSLLPKVMVALPVMMAVAIKMNSFSVFGAELAKEGV
ncbi:MAG: serine/threonine-protein kinase, partial [Coprobacillus sp.]